ncbi:MAG: hypothetical protein IJR89_04175 [Clostridia bacterium]|nr:hypothetical protein [Clostridia bacterium]
MSIFETLSKKPKTTKEKNEAKKTILLLIVAAAILMISGGIGYAVVESNALQTLFFLIGGGFFVILLYLIAAYIKINDTVFPKYTCDNCGEYQFDYDDIEKWEVEKNLYHDDGSLSLILVNMYCKCKKCGKTMKVDEYLPGETPRLKDPTIEDRIQYCMDLAHKRR